MVQVGPKTIHFESGKDRRGDPWLIGAEWQKPSRWLGGYSYFNNSFDQKCHYLYLGRTWPFDQDSPAWYFKLTGGIIEGYREPFEHKIPFNHNGVAPGVIAGVGYKRDRVNMQVNLLGSAGIMFTIGYDLVR